MFDSALEEHCSVHIAEGRASVFDSVKHLQRLASSLCFNQILTPTTMWNQSQTEVQYNKYRIKISDLTRGVEKMLKDLQEMMYKFSGGKPIPYTVPQDIVDDLSSTGRGQSWLKSCYSDPQDQALMHEMVKQGLWTLSRVGSDGKSLIWSRVACADFMRDVGEIVDRIITLVHIGSGPPLRGEEIVRDQISNGVQLRTIYLSFGQILAIRRHSKNTNAKGKDPFNVCYFPQSLTNAISYYLLIIRPLEQLVAWNLYHDPKRCKPYDEFLYVKEGNRMTSSQFSATLARLTKEYIGTSLSLQPLRHIIIAFQRAFVEELRVDVRDNIADLISSHKSKTAINKYAIEYGSLEGYIERHLQDVQEWCDRYHNAIGLGTRVGPLLSLRTKKKLADELSSTFLLHNSGVESAVAPPTVSHVLEQLGSASYRLAFEDLKPFISQELSKTLVRVMGDLYGDTRQLVPPVLVPHPPQTAAAQLHPQTAPAIPVVVAQNFGPAQRFKRGFSVISNPEEPDPKRTNSTTKEPSRTLDLPQESHQSSQVEIRDENNEDQQPSHRPTEDSGVNVSAGSSSSAHSLILPSSLSDIALLGLQKILRDPSANFKSSHQAQLLCSVLERKYTIGILPTGGGKSAAYEVPPAVLGQITVVVLPFRAIKSQAVEKCKEIGLGAEVWTKDTNKVIGKTTRLIIMALETFVDSAIIE